MDILLFVRKTMSMSGEKRKRKEREREKEKEEEEEEDPIEEEKRNVKARRNPTKPSEPLSR